MNDKVGEKRKRNKGGNELYNPFSDKEEYYEMEEGETQVPFDINEVNFLKDRNGIKYFSSFILSNNISEFVDIVMGGNNIPNPLTSVIKVSQEDEDVEMKDDDDVEMNEEVSEVDTTNWDWEKDVYGFISLIDLQRNMGKNCVKEIKGYLLQNCDNHLRNQLNSVLNDCTGLIINEHVVNLPFKLSGMLHKNLFEEFKKEIEKNTISFFKYFIVIAKIYENVQKNDFEHKKKKVKATPIFVKSEEQFYYNRSLFSFKIEMKSEHSFDDSTPSIMDNVKFFKLVIVVSRDKIRKVIKSIENATNFQQ